MRKILVGIVISVLLICSVSCMAAETETAYPSTAEVIIDGKKVDFCAYNLYGSNYFMLRDVALSLNGTDKSFNIIYYHNNGSIYFNEFEDYTSVGTEFMQKSKNIEEALFSAQTVTRQGEGQFQESQAKEYALVGYNINGSNYFKIRDIARIFDFYISYNNGHIMIDTSKVYEAEKAYEPAGMQIGKAHESDLPLFINEMPIVSYYAPCETAYNAEQLGRINKNPRLNGVYINAADLTNYGFDKKEHGGNIYLTRNKNKAFGILDGVIINSAPTGVYDVFGSDEKVYLDGEPIRTVIADNMFLIAASELMKYGDVYNNYHYLDYSGNVLQDRINIDFMRDEITERFNSMGEGETVPITLYSNPETQDDALKYFLYNRTCAQGKLIKKEGMWQYAISHGVSGTENEKYIGDIRDNKFNGNGIWEKASSSTGAGSAALNRWRFERGDFENGALVNGIYLYSAGGKPNITGERIEGNMNNGYKREFFVFQGRDEKYRFGYRTVREGEVKGGEYCGYYREYDENGELIFDDYKN